MRGFHAQSARMFSTNPGRRPVAIDFVAVVWEVFWGRFQPAV